MRVFVAAGEPSGDRLGALVVRALRARHPDAHVDGIGGQAMRDAGVRLLETTDRLGVVGVAEGAGSLAHHVRLLRRARARLRATPYDVVIPIDYPGFNVRLAAIARACGAPVLYYVAPQLWAWGAWRAPRLRRAVSRIAAVLPFEPPFFEKLGVEAEFVGHPLLDLPPAPERSVARAHLGVPADVPLLALFPGSRRGEARRLWPGMAGAAHRLCRDVPGLHVAVATPAPLPTPVPETWVMERDARLVARAADAAICKSGTITLEAALLDLPMVIGYRVHPVTAFLARRLLRVGHVGLVNLVCEPAIVPELLQADLSPAALAQAVRPLLDRDGDAARRQRAAFAAVRTTLGSPGASARVADLALGLVA